MNFIKNLFCILFIEPVYEPSSTWYASGNSLKSSGVRRHIGGSNIDHHVFLGGSNGGGPIGIAWLGTACIRSSRGLNKIIKIAARIEFTENILND